MKGPYELPTFYMCHVCGQTRLKRVRRSDTLPEGDIPTLDDLDTFIEVESCGKCGRNAYPVYGRPKKRMIFPGSRVELVFDNNEECYYAYPPGVK